MTHGNTDQTQALQTDSDPLATEIAAQIAFALGSGVYTETLIRNALVNSAAYVAHMSKLDRLQEDLQGARDAARRLRDQRDNTWRSIIGVISEMDLNSDEVASILDEIGIPESLLPTKNIQVTITIEAEIPSFIDVADFSPEELLERCGIDPMDGYIEVMEE